MIVDVSLCVSMTADQKIKVCDAGFASTIAKLEETYCGNMPAKLEHIAYGIYPCQSMTTDQKNVGYIMTADDLEETTRSGPRSLMLSR